MKDIIIAATTALARFEKKYQGELSIYSLYACTSRNRSQLRGVVAFGVISKIWDRRRSLVIVGLVVAAKQSRTTGQSTI